MEFKMDEQSYKDLNIFNDADSSFSLFELFKNTKTIGGRQRIEDIMRNPSNDINKLTQRRDSIDYFARHNIKLDIRNDHFDLILHYINYDKGHLRGNLIDSTFAFLRNRMKSSQNYYVIQIGLKHLLKFLKYCDELSSEFINSNAPSLLSAVAKRIKDILEKPDIGYALKESFKKRISFHQLAVLDEKIRTRNSFVLMELISLFYELDVIETLSKLAIKRDFCLPTYIEEEEVNIKIEGLFHPALENPVRNNIYINETNNLTFLSGSNMSGKSSLLKSIGISIYLSHLGFPVPAKKISTTVFNGLITTINLPDNIKNGLSHYFSEVKRVKEIATSLIATNKMFIILDELFKGTNAKDAFDASLLVINGFSEIKNSIFIVSSHITELAGELRGENIAFSYLEHLMIKGSPEFTYIVKEGVEKEGIGMYFIQHENIVNLLKQAKSSLPTPHKIAPNSLA